uniref:Quinolinate phosphoribosyl transferase C-terminal domain-containing protein n=1 Tax=Serinus canaria TaxID=9135 RepID=A0A8C9KVW5_SERCA
VWCPQSQFGVPNPSLLSPIPFWCPQSQFALPVWCPQSQFGVPVWCPQSPFLVSPIPVCCPSLVLSPQDLQDVSVRVKAAHPGVTIEASGGVTLESLSLFLLPQVDVVSMGCLTHGATNVDFALKPGTPKNLAWNPKI